MIVNQVDRKIGSHYYTFENGILKTGWYQLPAAPAAEENTETATDSNAEGAAEPAALSVGDFQYYEEDGKRAEGWYQIEGAPGISEEGEIFTFYFKKGSPYHASEGIQTFNISSKRYAFNTRGEMMTGLQVVTTESGSTANYYCGDDDLDENQTWIFLTEGGNKGQGFHGVRDNHVYRQGLRLDAERDLRYAPVELDGVQYLVNPSGTIQKASSSSKSDAKPELGKGFKDYKDSNDKIWTVNTSGVIQQ